jgi:hypothetical protein
LRSDVFPMKKEIIDTTNNLELNTTARRNDKTLDKFSPYMTHMTYAVLEAKLAYPIGSFVDKVGVDNPVSETALSGSASQAGIQEGEQRPGSDATARSGT